MQGPHGLHSLIQAAVLKQTCYTVSHVRLHQPGRDQAFAVPSPASTEPRCNHTYRVILPCWPPAKRHMSTAGRLHGSNRPEIGLLGPPEAWKTLVQEPVHPSRMALCLVDLLDRLQLFV